MSLAILFHFLCAKHVSDINISIIRSLRLFCWITTLVVLFLVRCVSFGEFRCGWFGVVSVLQAEAKLQPATRIPLLMMAILMSETCWAHKKCTKIASDIKLVFYSSTSNIYIFFVVDFVATVEFLPTFLIFLLSRNDLTIVVPANGVSMLRSANDPINS